MLHTIFEKHFKDFCDLYEEQNADRYGKFHLSCIMDVTEHFTEEVLLKLPHRQFVFTRDAWASRKHSGFSIDNSVRILTDKARISLAEYITRAPVSLKKLHYESFKGRVLFHTRYNQYFGENIHMFDGLDFLAELTGTPARAGAERSD